MLLQGHGAINCGLGCDHPPRWRPWSARSPSRPYFISVAAQLARAQIEQPRLRPHLASAACIFPRHRQLRSRLHSRSGEGSPSPTYTLNRVINVRLVSYPGAVKRLAVYTFVIAGACVGVASACRLKAGCGFHCAR